MPAEPAESTEDGFCDLPGGIRLCYRADEDASAVPLLLIAGLGLDLTSWPRPMLDALRARGFRVIRFDNRDAGRSTRVPAPPPGLLRQLVARPPRGAYTLEDMAEDTATPSPARSASHCRPGPGADCSIISASTAPTSSACRWAA